MRERGRLVAQAYDEKINGVLCFTIKWFWIIAVSPKVAQLFIFFILSAGLFWAAKDRLRITAPFGFLFAWCAIYFFSILINSADVLSIERLLAALNTFGIWLTSILFALCVQSVRKIDIASVSKYAAFNVIALVGFYLVSDFLNLQLSLPWDGKELWKTDWGTNGDIIARFTGLLGYSNSVVFVFLIFVPLAIPWMSSKKSVAINTLFLASAAYSAISCGSRAGFLIVVPLAILLWFHLLRGCNLSGRKYLTIYLLCCAVCVPLLIVEWQDLADTVNSLVYARVNSNSTRLNLYQNSISETLAKSPFIGMGIKDIEEGSNLPLGSHSTYIGIFFRTGIIGACLMVAFLISYYIAKHNRGARWSFMSVIWLIGFSLFIVIEDIDGLNWILFFVFIAALVLFRCDLFSIEKLVPIWRTVNLRNVPKSRQREEGCSHAH